MFLHHASSPIYSPGPSKPIKTIDFTSLAAASSLCANTATELRRLLECTATTEINPMLEIIGTSAAEAHGDDIAPQPYYFSVSPKKLILMSVCTLGVYDLYWFYKNWTYVRYRGRVRIRPALRSSFAIFYCYAIFAEIKTSAEKDKTGISFPAGPLACAWIAAKFLAYLPGPYGLISYAAPLCMISVQLAANRINDVLSPGYSQNYRCTTGNIITVAIGGLVFVAGIVGSFLYPDY
jgi:hypothetical protein